MPRLPDSNSLGTATPQSSRGIVSYRGDQVGDAVTQLGNTGMRIGTVLMQEDAQRERQEKAKQDRLELAYAKSTLLRGQIEAEDTLTQDQDYASYKPRYLEQVGKTRATAAAMITDPAMREMFEMDAETDILRGVTSINAKARAKEADYGRASLDETLNQNMDAALRAGDEATKASLHTATREAIFGARDRGYITADQAVKLNRDYAVNTAIKGIEMLPPREQLAALMPKGEQPAGEAFIPTDPSAPRGVRNNNPGNLRDSGDAWEGMAGKDDGGYLQFSTPEAGLRAMAINLKNQQEKHGLNTVTEIVSKYAPASENDTGAYIRTVSKSLGVAPDAPIDLKDEKTLSSLVGAMIKHENGQQPFSPEQIEGGAKAALGLAPMADAAPRAAQPSFGKTGTIVDYIPPDKRMELIRKNQMVLRSDLERKAQDSVAMAAQGQQDPEPLKEDDFFYAYGANEGTLKYQEFQKQQQLGQRISQVGNLTPAQQAGLLESARPKPGDGFAQEQKNFDMLARAVETVNKQRQEDPIGFAMARQPDVVQPLDFGNPQGLPSQLQERSVAAKSMHDQFGAPLKLMSNQEAKQFSAALDSMPTQGKLDTLKLFRDATGDPALYQEALQQIRPDSPVTAMAGMYLGLDRKLTTESRWFKADDQVSPETVAARMIEGEALLNPTKAATKEDGKGKLFPMPPDGSQGKPGLRQEFDSYAGESFRGMPKAADQAFQAVRAYYAGEAARQGDFSGTLDSKIAQQAVKAVIGNVVPSGDKKIIAPWGMDATTFNDMAKVNFDAAVAEQGFSRVRWSDATLENTGEPGTYRAVVGAGYLLGKDGRPLTIRVGP